MPFLQAFVQIFFTDLTQLTMGQQPQQPPPLHMDHTGQELSPPLLQHITHRIPTLLIHTRLLLAHSLQLDHTEHPAIIQVMEDMVSQLSQLVMSLLEVSLIISQSKVHSLLFYVSFNHNGNINIYGFRSIILLCQG